MKFKFQEYCKSFTLVELSIVILVLSLLVTATLSGSKIIINAKATRVIREIANYRQAINQFYQMYGSLPGDYNNAQYKLAPSGYTTKSAQELSALSKDVLDKIPLNGSSSGTIEGNINTFGNIHFSEMYGVWSHLSASNLIEGKYSNTCYDINASDRINCNKIGYNLPRITDGYNKNSAFLFYTSSLADNDRKIYGAIFDQIKANGEYKYYNILLLSDPTRNYVYNSSTIIDDYAIFGGGGGVSSEIMMKIDSKIDDGKPFSGQVFGVNGANEDDKINNSFKEGQCNTYTGSNDNFTGDNYDYFAYTNSNKKSCIGIILFSEFNN